MNVDDPSNNKKRALSVSRNLHVLARLSVSGLLAFAYMHSFVVATLGAGGYYLFQKLGAKKGVKDGEWIMLAFIVFGLALLRKILGPAKLALELVVTSFFSYLFLILAQGDE